MVDDNRAIFMFRDGSQAWEAKNFLVEQDRCASVTIENKVYPGKDSTEKVVSYFIHNSSLFFIIPQNFVIILGRETT